MNILCFEPCHKCLPRRYNFTSCIDFVRSGEIEGQRARAKHFNVCVGTLYSHLTPTFTTTNAAQPELRNSRSSVDQKDQ